MSEEDDAQYSQTEGPPSAELLAFKRQKAWEAKEKGNKAFKNRQWRDAVNLYSEALEFAWEDKTEKYKIYSNRALAYHKQDRPELATDDAYKCICINQNWAKGYYRLGSALLTMQKPFEAYAVFEAGTQMAPQNRLLRKIARNLKEFDRWKKLNMEDPLAEKWRFHLISLMRNPRNYFRNLTDETYVKALKNSITNVLKETKGKYVLYEGSGTGLGPMIAYKAGAEFVVSCERWKYYGDCSREIMRQNGFDIQDEIFVVNKRPAELLLGNDCGDIPERVDILITELYDEGLLGLGIIQAINYAKDELLNKEHQIIPAGATVYAQMIEMRTTYVCGFDLSEFNKYRWNAHYEPINLSEHKYTTISDVFDVFNFNFWREKIEGRQKLLKVPIRQSGIFNAVVFWYRLDLDDENSFTTDPSSQWRQALQYFEEIPVNQGDTFNLKACHNTTKLWFELEDENELAQQQPQTENSVPEEGGEEDDEGIFTGPEPTEEDLKDTYAKKRSLPKGQKHAISRWQFKMLEDTCRNEAYNRAINKIINTMDDPRVLEIGSGCGLLSMMAVRAGATEVTAFEEIQHLASLSNDIIKRNVGVDKVKVIPKNSTRMMRKDEPRDKPNLLITETFDNGLLGEGALMSIHHAHRHLASPSKCIPCGGKVYGVLLEVPLFEDVCGFNMKEFTHFRPEDYTGVKIEQEGHSYLSDVFEVFSFDFSNYDNHRQADERFINVKPSKTGKLGAVALWYTLNLDKDVSLSSAPGSSTHWEQAVFFIPEGVPVSEGVEVPLRAKHDISTITFEIESQYKFLPGKNKKPHPAWWYEMKSLEEKIQQSEEYNMRGITPPDFRMIYMLVENSGAVGLDPEAVVNFMTHLNANYQLPHIDEIPDRLKKLADF